MLKLFSYKEKCGIFCTCFFFASKRQDSLKFSSPCTSLADLNDTAYVCTAQRECYKSAQNTPYEMLPHDIFYTKKTHSQLSLTLARRVDFNIQFTTLTSTTTIKKTNCFYEKAYSYQKKTKTESCKRKLLHKFLDTVNGHL